MPHELGLLELTAEGGDLRVFSLRDDGRPGIDVQVVIRGQRIQTVRLDEDQARLLAAYLQAALGD